MILIDTYTDDDSQVEYVEAMLVIGTARWMIERTECGTDEINLEQLDGFLNDWEAKAARINLKFKVSKDVEDLRKEIEDAESTD